MIPAVLGLRDKNSYLLSFLLVAAMEPTVFGEAIVWTSGFSNYVWPLWLTLVIVLLVQHFSAVNSACRLLICLLVPILGTASQLFVKHSSGINGLLAFSLLVYYLLRKEKRKAALCGLWLISVTVGLGMMLAIPRILYRAGNRVETYQEVHLGSIPTMVVFCAKNALHLASYYYGACEIPLCFGAFFTVWKTRQKRSEKSNRILFGLTGLAAVYLALGMILSVNAYLGKAAAVQHIISAGSVLIPICVWVIAAWKLEPAQKRSQLFFLGFAFVSLLPLLVVAPTPPRVILQSYVFVILAALQCFSWSGLGSSKRAQKILLCVCLCLTVLLSSVFFSIHSMVSARDAHIRTEVENGSREIVIFGLLYQYTTWDHLWSQGYPYKDAGEITFDLMDFASWSNAYYQ